MKKINILNRKTIFIIIGVVLGILLVLALVDFLLILTGKQMIVPASACEELFGCAPEEFLHQKSNSYSEVGNFRRLARVDAKGQLILYLTQKQANVWCSLLQQELNDAENQYNIDISDDYSVITVYGYEETYLEEGTRAAKLIYKMVLIRNMRGENSSYRYILKDAVTGNTVIVRGVDDNGQNLNYHNQNHKFSSIIEKDKSSQ